MPIPHSHLPLRTSGLRQQTSQSAEPALSRERLPVIQENQVLEMRSPAAAADLASVNLTYRYDNTDIDELLARALSEPLSQKRVYVYPAVDRAQLIVQALSEWLDNSVGLRLLGEPALLVVPFSPQCSSGAPSQHWATVLIGLCGSGHLEVAYLDPMRAQSKVPDELANLVRSCAPNRSVDCVSVRHPVQQDMDSCGPYSVCDTTESAEKFLQSGHLPSSLDRAGSALALRREHIRLAGGAESRFGRSQAHNAVAPEADYHAIAQMRSSLQDKYYDLIYSVTDQEHAYLSQLIHKDCPSEKCLTKLMGVRPSCDPALTRWTLDFFKDAPKIYQLQRQLMGAFEALGSHHPRFFDAIMKDWSQDRDAMLVVKRVRIALCRLLDDVTNWQTPERTSLCETARAMLNGFMMTPNMTEAQIKATEVCDLSVLEWALTHSLERHNESFAFYQ